MNPLEILKANFAENLEKQGSSLEELEMALSQVHSIQTKEAAAGIVDLIHKACLTKQAAGFGSMGSKGLGGAIPQHMGSPVNFGSAPSLPRSIPAPMGGGLASVGTKVTPYSPQVRAGLQNNSLNNSPTGQLGMPRVTGPGQHLGGDSMNTVRYGPALSGGGAKPVTSTSLQPSVSPGPNNFKSTPPNQVAAFRQQNPGSGQPLPQGQDRGFYQQPARSAFGARLIDPRTRQDITPRPQSYPGMTPTSQLFTQSKQGSYKEAFLKDTASIGGQIIGTGGKAWLGSVMAPGAIVGTQLADVDEDMKKDNEKLQLMKDKIKLLKTMTRKIQMENV